MYLLSLSLSQSVTVASIEFWRQRERERRAAAMASDVHGVCKPWTPACKGGRAHAEQSSSTRRKKGKAAVVKRGDAAHDDEVERKYCGVGVGVRALRCE